MIPSTYSEWRHCIEVKCGIPLEKSYILGRIETLQQASLPETKKFRNLYGDEHWQRVTSFFQQALTEVS